MAAFSNPQAYERWMGRWSTRLAPLFVRFGRLGSSGRFLDVGAGTGVLACAIVAEIDDAEVVGIEPAVEYVDFAHKRFTDPRLRFESGDAQTIAFDSDTFDGALALLILQEVSDAPKAVAEMRRVTRPGGCVTASQWDFRNGLPMLSLFWETVQEVLPDDEARAEIVQRTPPGYSEEDALAQLWNQAGLVEIETAALEIAMEFTSFDDYWRPFLSGATPTSSYAATLSDEARQTLMARLRQKVLGNGPDRPFTLPARAWAVRGVVS
jgi:SAM-dependent methyltransferase